MRVKLLSLFIALSSFSMASIGENYYIPNALPMGYGNLEVSYLQGYIYDPALLTFSIRSKVKYAKAVTDVMHIVLSNEYDNGSLIGEFGYTFYQDINHYLGFGYRNLGATNITSHNIGREYLAYTYQNELIELTVGVQRANFNSFGLSYFAGADVHINDGILFAIIDDSSAYIGLKWSMFDDVQFDLVQNVTNQSSNVNYKTLEMGFTYTENEIVKRYESKAGTKKERRALKTLEARMKAIEFIASPRFQQKLFDELKKNRISEVVLNESRESILNASLLHVQRGLEYYYQGDLEKSLLEYQLANSLTPHLALIHERLGSIYYELRRFNDSAREWTLAIKIEPDNFEVESQLKRLAREHSDLFKNGAYLDKQGLVESFLNEFSIKDENEKKKKADKSKSTKINQLKKSIEDENNPIVKQKINSQETSEISVQKKETKVKLAIPSKKIEKTNLNPSKEEQKPAQAEQSEVSPSEASKNTTISGESNE
jgi:hypothetical protein